MFKQVLVVLLVFLSLIPLFSATSGTLSCTYRAGSCFAGESLVFWASDDLSAHIRTSDQPQGPYPYAVCCSSAIGQLSLETVPSTFACNNASDESVLYFTDNINARAAKDYDPTHHTHKLCVGYDDSFSNFDLIVSQEQRYNDAGYDCLFRMNSPENSHISSCDRTYGSGQQYDYTVWVRLFESLNAIKCNADCTSRLDNRVYSACAAPIRECRAVPVECDGALLGSWVRYSDTQEVQCSAPWNNFRDRVFTENTIEVSSTTQDECQNVISIKETVLLDNEPVVMTIYICSD